MEEMLESKGIQAQFDKITNENGTTQLFFYDKYFIKQLTYGEAVHTSTILYEDVISYRQEEKFLSLYGKHGDCLGVFYEQESVLPLVCEHLGREIPTLDEWIVCEFGESGERFVYKKARHRLKMISDFVFYKNYLRYEEDGSVYIVSYGDIVALMWETVRSHHTSYIRLVLLVRETDGTVRYMSTGYFYEEAKAYCQYLKKKILASRSYVLYTRNGVGRVLSRGLSPKYPKKKPKNRSAIFSYQARELYEIYLYNDAMTLICYRIAKNRVVAPEQYAISYTDIQRVAYEKTSYAEKKPATITIEGAGLPEGRLTIYAKYSYDGTDAFYKTFALLKELTGK